MLFDWNNEGRFKSCLLSSREGGQDLRAHLLLGVGGGRNKKLSIIWDWCFEGA